MLTAERQTISKGASKSHDIVSNRQMRRNDGLVSGLTSFYDSKVDFQQIRPLSSSPSMSPHSCGLGVSPSIPAFLTSDSEYILSA